MGDNVEGAVLSVDECAELLKLSRGSTYQGCLRGQIPCIKVGRRILIPRVALQKLLESASKPKKKEEGKE